MEINSSNGNIVKEKHYGGNKNDGAKRIIANDDGSYFVIGVTSSYGTDNTQNVWLLKLNSFLDTL